MKSLSSVIECAETELSKTKKDKTLILSFNSLFSSLKEKVFLSAIGYVMVQQMQFLIQFSGVSTSNITGDCGIQHLCKTVSAIKERAICSILPQ